MKKILLTILLVAMTTTIARAQDEPDPLVWDGSISSSLIEYEGTIEIYTPADLAAIHKLWDNYKDGDRGYVGWTIKLMNDIDLNNINFHGLTIGWYDGHRFGGNFDGQGHIIKNLKIHGDDDNRGLFGWVDNGRIENLKLVNVDIRASDGGGDCHIGGLCGRVENYSTISHCAVVGGTVRGTKDDTDEVGAIVGYMKKNHNDILYCYSDVTVEGGTQIGGIVGKIEQGDDHASSVRHCYFSGKIIHHGDEYFGAIAGERYGQPMENNFFLDRSDGVRATGNQSKYDGSSYHSVKGEIKECTEEELKQPLLFRNFNEENYTLESDQYVYPFDGYPELKVFLRYDVGDSFYVTNAGHMGENTADSIPGHVKIVKNDSSPFSVTLEKAGVATAETDFVINDTFKPYFNDKVQLKTVGLGSNVFENLGVVNTVTIPAAVDSVGLPQRHQVQNAFILNGNEGAVKDGGLYCLKNSYFVTAPKTFTSLTIHQEFADKIADYALENMGSLQTIYVDTWVEAGTLVDAYENTPPTIMLDGDNIFSGCPAGLDVYVKDGTTNQLFLGYQGPGGYGYSNADKWKLFYSNYEDVENHMFTYFPVNRNGGGMSTLILGYPVELPEGVTAWWAKSISNGRLNMAKINSQVLPALTPVLLTYEGTGPLYLSRYDGDNPGAATDFENDLFKGSVDPGGHTMTASEMMTNFLTLGRPRGDTTYDNLGFYGFHPKNNVLPSYVAWLASNDIPANAQLMMSFDDEATAISDAHSVQHDDMTAAPVFDLQGRRVAIGALPTAKGLYIVKGKKVKR